MLYTLKIKNGRIWYDADLLPITNDELKEEIFNVSYWQVKQKIIGNATGRGTTWFIQLDLLQAALRHYFRGGLFGKIIRDSYIFTSWEKTRSYQEFELLTKLYHSGVNVPRPIAARAIKLWLTYKADLICEKIVNAIDLVELLKKGPLSTQQYKDIGEQIAKMHQVGVNHTDLNIHNILIDNQSKVWIIDFDKCHLNATMVQQQQNLVRLKRSFDKELKKRKINWQESDFDALLDGYYAMN